jgi:hypothetical protein
MKGVRKWTKDGACTKKPRKAASRKPGKSKKGRNMGINKENGWILDQP